MQGRREYMEDDFAIQFPLQPLQAASDDGGESDGGGDADEQGEV